MPTLTIEIYSPDRTHLDALSAYSRRNWPDAEIVQHETGTVYRVDAYDDNGERPGIRDYLDARSLYWDQIDSGEMRIYARTWRRASGA